jgi:lysophospholipase L1-like esterase
MASLANLDAGMYIPPHSLDRWALNPTSGLKHVVFAGDSTMQGTNSLVVLQTNTFPDGYVDRVRRALSQANPPLVGQGFYDCWRSRNLLGAFQSSGEWTATGAMVQTSQDNTNLVPFTGMYSGSVVGDTVTWTPPGTNTSRVVKDLQTLNATAACAASMNGINTSTFVGAQNLNVASAVTIGTGPGQFPNAGTLCIGSAPLPLGGGSTAVVSYTNIGGAGTQFQNCTLVAGASFVMATGNPVTNQYVITSATAAFGSNDQGSVIWGSNMPRNQSITLSSFSGSTAITMLPNTGSTSGPNGFMGIQARNQVLGGIQQIDVLYEDIQFGNQWSYSLSGGGFVNGPAIAHNNPPVLKKFSIVTANPTSFQLRCADTVPANHLAAFAGIIVYSVAAPTTGIIVHNMAKDGAMLGGGALNTGNSFVTGPTALAAGGDTLRILDANGDPNSTGSLHPTLVIVMFVNDAVNGSTPTQYVADLTTLYNRISPYGDLLVMSPWEFGLAAPVQTQAAFRAATKQFCAQNNVAYLDLYEAWAVGLGLVGASAANQAGLTVGDGAHPSSAGHADIAARICRMLGLTLVP